MRRSFRGRQSCCSCCASTRVAQAGCRGAGAAASWSTETLRAMAMGGMRDHVGGGFHRYSVDARVARPALREDALRPGAARARVSRGARRRPAMISIATVAEDTLAVRAARLTDPRGGFYSAEDADSVPPDEQASPTRARRRARSTSGPTTRSDGCSARMRPSRGGDSGSSPTATRLQDPQGELRGQNILYIAQSIEDIAARSGRSAEERRRGPRPRAPGACSTPGAKRPRPHLDDKVLTAWNGLMIAAFARAGTRADRTARGRRR